MNRLLRNILLFTMMAVMLISGTVSAYAASDTAEPSKLNGEPTGIEAMRPRMQTLTATQSERITNPNIVYTYSPMIVNGAGPIIFTDSTTGMPAYCIDYNRSIPSPDSLDGENDFDPETIFDPATYDGLKCLLLAGYPYEKGNGLTDAEAQGCTQLAIWCWTYETMGYGLNAANYTAIAGKEYIYDYFVGLLEAARNQSWPELELSAIDVHMVKNGETLTGQTTVSFRNLNGGYSLDESKLPEGVTVSGYSGNDGDMLTFTAPLSFAGQSLVLEAILSGHDERSALNLFWYDNKNPNQQRMAISVTDTATVAVSASIAMEFQGIGGVNLIKLSASDSKPLSNAVFGVYRADNDEFVTEVTTDENGEATLHLPVGDYYLLEHTAPEGYVKSDEKINFSIVNGETIQKIVENSKKAGFVKVIKTASHTENPLEGVVFGVFKDGEKVCELITGADGTATSPALALGDYELRELATVTGYQLLDKAIPFTISVNGAVIELSVENEPIIGSVKIIKKDDAENALNGAVFGIFNAFDDVKIAEVTTSGAGLAVYDNLPYGSYYLKELTAPAGFFLSSEKIPFEVKTQGETIELTVVNTKEPVPVGKIRLIKADADTTQTLENAVFGVFATANDAKVCELKTGADGTALSPELPVGDYYLKELTAPTGYELKTDKISVTVKDGETVEVKATNKALPIPPAVGKIKIIKKADDTGKKLSNAVFGLYKSSNDEKVCELTTGNDGTAISPELPSGEYYLKEIKAPVGYKLNDDKVSVQIKADKTVEITVVNLPEPKESDPDPTDGKIRLIKKDDKSNKLLVGAVFGVYKASNDVKVCELTTDSDGEAVSPLLPAGDYYLKELKAPDGYELSTEKFGVTVKADKVTDITIKNPKKPDPTPTPKPTPKPDPKPTPTSMPDTSKGELLLLKKAAQSGNPLSGAVFGVYQASEGKKITELTTDASGKAKLSLAPGEYYLKELKAPYGYLLEESQIAFTVSKNVTVTVEVTNLRDETIPDADVPLGGITVPKTGEDFPTVNYVMGSLLLVGALICSVRLSRKRKIRLA